MEIFSKTYRPARRSFYKPMGAIFLILILAIVASFIGPMQYGTSLFKWMWIIAAVLLIVLMCYVFVKRRTMKLRLTDDPNKIEDCEVAFTVYNWTRPFSGDFRRSIEIGLKQVVHIEVHQSALQTLLGIGDILIASGGTDEREISAPNMPNPDQIRDEIQSHARKYTMPVSQPQEINTDNN